MIKKKSRRGFTLVELVVVIAIIAVLMALAIVTINTVRRQSRNAQLREDARIIEAALEAYATSNASNYEKTDPFKAYPKTNNVTDGGYPTIYNDSWSAYDLFDTSKSDINPTYGSLAKYITNADELLSHKTLTSGKLCYYNYTVSKSTGYRYFLWVRTEEDIIKRPGLLGCPNSHGTTPNGDKFSFKY